jgi:hypothetical protein
MMTGGWLGFPCRSFVFETIQPSVSLSTPEAIGKSSRFFSNDLDKAGLRRINKSVGHRVAQGSGLCGARMCGG